MCVFSVFIVIESFLEWYHLNILSLDIWCAPKWSPFCTLDPGSFLGCPQVARQPRVILGNWSGMTVVPPDNLPCLKLTVFTLCGCKKMFANCIHQLPLNCSPRCTHAMQTTAHSAGNIHTLAPHMSHTHVISSHTTGTYDTWEWVAPIG